MRIPDATLQRILTNLGKATPEIMEPLLDEARGANAPLQDVVLKHQLISESELTQTYAKEIDVPYIDLSKFKIEKDTLQKIPERIAEKYRAVLFDDSDEKKPKLAIDDPDDIQAVDFLQKELGKGIEIYIATRSDIQKALDGYKGSISSELSKVVTDSDGLTDEEEDAAISNVSEEDLAEDSPIAQTVNLLLEYAIKSGASDIHIEPREKLVQVRYRVDGVLREANKLPRKVLAALVSRIKILSNLKIDEHRAPQDGRFKISLNNQQYAIRVSTLPVMDGEKVVMRLLDESTQALALEDLGFWGESLSRIKDAISQPYGIILVTGPTGSGKSTTLYSVLSMLNSPGVNISTVEDPVEYRIPGVNQTQMNPKAGMTFASGLRALLRQDPNVIMVGEIRDGETADLAIQAALTGHLVFSTLHTNNAATAIPRLLDMGSEPFLIASTVRAVIGQRLVRRLKSDTREPYQPTEAEVKEIKENFRIEEAIENAKLSQKQKNDANDNAEKAEDVQIKSGTLTLWRPKEGIQGSGYGGRVGIYEVLAVSSKVQDMITNHATSEQIQDQAIEEGMLTMSQDGFVKAIQGQTTLEEILRVTRE